MEQVLTQLRRLLGDAPFRTAICGGWAIDLHLGRQTRSHADVDLVVFCEDRAGVISFMQGHGWTVYEAQGGGLVRELSATAVHDRPGRKSLFWACPGNARVQVTPAADGLLRFHLDATEPTGVDYVEYLFSDRADGALVYDGNASIRRTLDKAILTGCGSPYLAPEVVLLYKSSTIDRDGYREDFARATVGMDAERLAWLERALATQYPQGHPWLTELETRAR